MLADDEMTARLARDHLAQEVTVRQADLVTAVERWATRLADAIDAIAESLAVAEEPACDEVGRRRVERAVRTGLEELGAVGSALRMGPPETVGYRLRALARDLERVPAPAEQNSPRPGTRPQ